MVDTRVEHDSPDYVVRVFTRRLGVIYLNNVLNIHTSINTEDGGTGSFNITLDYKQGELLDFKNSTEKELFSRNAYFFAIEPMDYVEIYLRRDPPVNDEGRISMYNNMIAPIGIYSAKGNYLRAFNQDKKTMERLNPFKELPLTIEEKINNPDFVLCGFIDAVHNNFNGDSNTITINGRGVKKFLDVHSTWTAIPDQSLIGIINFKNNVIQASEAPALAVKQILKMFLEEYFVGLASFEKFEQMSVVNIKTSLSPDIKVMEDLSKENFSKTNVGQDYKNLQSDKNFAKDMTKNKDGTTDVTFEQQIRDFPSTWHIKYALSLDSYDTSAQVAKDIKEWGRLEFERKDLIARIARTTSPTGTIWSTINEFSWAPFNELFVDETGNIVLRDQFKAWTVPDYSVNTHSYINDRHFRYMTRRQTIRKTAFEEWIKIDESQIISWNFSRTDAELKTLVQNTPTSRVMGNLSVLGQYLGTMPVTEMFIKSIEKTSSEKPKTSIKILLDKLKKHQKKHFNGYPLGSTEGLLRYWTRYGIRPVSFRDFYSSTMEDSILNAAALFDHYGSNFWTGTITVKGNQQYKIGRRMKVTLSSPLLNSLSRNFLSGLKRNVFLDISANNPDDKVVIYFYCTGVEHSFNWGAGWTTTLTVSRGEIPGTLSDTSAKLSYVVKQKTAITDKNKEVTAVPRKPSKPFSTDPVTLSIEVNNSSGGTVDTKTGKYQIGSQVNLIARPNTGWIFEKWSGQVSSTDNPYKFTINNDTKVIALFREATVSIQQQPGQLEKNSSGTNLVKEDGTNIPDANPQKNKNSVIIAKSQDKVPGWVDAEKDYQYANETAYYYIRGSKWFEYVISYKDKETAKANAKEKAKTSVLSNVNSVLRSEIYYLTTDKSGNSIFMAASAEDRKYFYDTLEKTSIKITSKYDFNAEYWQHRYFVNDGIDKSYFHYFYRIGITQADMCSMRLTMTQEIRNKAAKENKTGVVVMLQDFINTLNEMITKQVSPIYTTKQRTYAESIIDSEIIGTQPTVPAWVTASSHVSNDASYYYFRSPAPFYTDISMAEEEAEENGKLIVTDYIANIVGTDIRNSGIGNSVDKSYALSKINLDNGDYIYARNIELFYEERKLTKDSTKTSFYNVFVKMRVPKADIESGYKITMARRAKQKADAYGQTGASAILADLITRYGG